MPSLIAGYEYDIFISYRQKDNKGDMWVSEFVEALKTELESTFKEEISIYFDINPHDGILETHDVDAFLKDKLKCLIFIPIISRTYCDPDSFAWKHEFEAFVEQASKDQFGLNVKLPDGRITSRILPVRIHDLEEDDIKLCESVLGGALHGVEFVYKEPGVNRSLIPKDDERKNLNGTIYRNQINKTALAIQEIIHVLRTEPGATPIKGYPPKEYSEKIDEAGKLSKSTKYKLMTGATIMAILIIAALFVWPGLARRNKPERLIAKDGRIPVAVLPFQNMTGDTAWNVWQEGVQNILITNLSNSQELKVRQPETVTSILQGKGLTDYASLTPSIKMTISKKLETNVYITGSIKRSGSAIRLNAQLIDSKKEEALKSFQIDGTGESILQITDSLSAQVMNFLAISKLGKGISKEIQHMITTTSPEAFKYFIYGENAFNKDDEPAAERFYLQAIAIDSNFYFAESKLAILYYNTGSYEEGKKLCLRVYNKRDQMPMQLKLWTESIYSVYFETSHERINCCRKIIEFDDQSPGIYYSLGLFLNWAEQYDKAIPEFKKGLEIYRKWGTKPQRSWDYLFLGIALHETGQYKKEKKLYRKAEKDFPDDPLLIPSQATLALTVGDTVAANRYIEKYVSILKENSANEIEIAYYLGQIYWGADKFDRAENYYRQALSIKPDNPYMMNDLAYLLFETDRNINEGLELVDKALKLVPDNYAFLDTKGWGLYKQGKYQEALEILQKCWDSLPRYDYTINSHLEAVKKAMAEQK
jgi:tetratricopeptide (TPR) repeat protein